MKKCPRCQKVKNFSEFYIKNKFTNKLSYVCKKCKCEYTTEWKRNNKNKVREYRKKYHIKYQYGITIEQYNCMFKKQNGLCDICRNFSSKKLGVDHCHKTGKIRGLLCERCNTGLGCFNDNTKLFEKAIKYLLKL